MESLHRFLDEDKENGSGKMGVIIYGSFLISNCHYGGEVVSQHELGNICRSGLKGG